MVNAVPSAAALLQTPGALFTRFDLRELGLGRSAVDAVFRPTLADRLAVAILEHGPSPGTKLALWVGVRKTDALRELQANPVFEQVGRGRGSKWKLAPEPLQAPWEPLGTESSATPIDELARRVRALEKRFTELERRLGADVLP